MTLLVPEIRHMKNSYGPVPTFVILRGVRLHSGRESRIIEFTEGYGANRCGPNKWWMLEIAFRFVRRHKILAAFASDLFNAIGEKHLATGQGSHHYYQETITSDCALGYLIARKDWLGYDAVTATLQSSHRSPDGIVCQVAEVRSKELAKILKKRTRPTGDELETLILQIELDEMLRLKSGKPLRRNRKT